MAFVINDQWGIKLLIIIRLSKLVWIYRNYGKRHKAQRKLHVYQNQPYGSSPERKYEAGLVAW